jgi:RNA polymerase sigma-70 factor (ECF subfamily)
VEGTEGEVAHLLDAGDLRSAAAMIMRAYGPAILAYLAALARDEVRTDEAFSQFSEDLWRGLPAFRRDASIRSWAYTLAWHAWLRLEREAFRRHGRPLQSAEISGLAAEIRSSTPLYLKPQTKDAVAQLRDQLSASEQSLLVLRIDRDMSWSEVASVMSTAEAPLDAATVTKRFQRVKEKLRKLAEAAGLLKAT